MADDWFAQHGPMPQATKNSDWFAAQAPSPPGFGEQFMTRLGENFVGLGAPLADPIGAIKGMLREGAMAVGAPQVLAYEKAKQIASQSLPENAADLAFNVGLAGIGAGLGKAGSAAGRGISAGLRDSLAATMAKPPSPGISAVPSNILRAIGRELMGAPEVFEARGGGPPVQFRPEDLPPVKIVAPPGVTYRPPAPGPRVVPPPAVGPMRPSASGEVFTGRGGGPPVTMRQPPGETPTGGTTELTPAPSAPSMQPVPKTPVPAGSVTPESLDTIRQKAAANNELPGKLLYRWVHEAAADAWGASKNLHSKLSEHLQQRYGVDSITKLSEQQLLDEYHALKHIAIQRNMPKK